ncbi:MAG: alkaline phosphatase family protein, partial [Myxococcales bacterium]|nr:alkaline phosphatase family protein [Myxococcales bacterium]
TAPEKAAPLVVEKVAAPEKAAPPVVEEAPPAPASDRPARAIARPSLGPAAYARRRVLVVGLDGLRPDVLELVSTPNLDRLAAEGAVSWDARAASVTLSGPGWTTLLTGVEADKHGVYNNAIKPQSDGWPTLFARLREARPDARTASFVAWKPLYDVLLDPHEVDDRVYHSVDRVVVRAAVKELATEDPILTFIHLDGVDKAGHKHGFDPRLRAYKAAVEVIDAQLGELLAAIGKRPNLAREEWLVIVTTDHGGTGKRHGENLPTDRRIFFIAHGPTVVPGPIEGTPSLLDVAPTVFAHLGVTPKASWKLEGDVVAVAPDKAVPTSATAAVHPVAAPTP